MTIRSVDRTTLDGTSINVMIGRNPIPCLKSSYGDKLESETYSEMGSQEIDGRGDGTYKTTDAKITMASKTFRERFAPLLQVNGYGNEVFPVVFMYQHPRLGSDSDLLEECRVTGFDAALEASNKALEVEFGLVFNQLRLTDRRITINRVKGGVGQTASKF